jgi:histidyl-tRNA synthetase
LTSNVQPARGTRDFLPADMRRREHVMAIVRRVYQSYGYEPLETPAFENIETLLGKYGEEGNRLIFKILRRGEHESSGEADLALRYDLTVPLARVVAQYQNELPKFFKRYQIQPVWRADRPARGRFREFYQCDVDAIGSTSPLVEVEQIAAVSDVLTALGFQDFLIDLNHRLILRSQLRNAGVPPALQGEALVALDKLDKIGRDGVAKELGERGVPPDAGERLLGWIGDRRGGDRLEWLERQFTDVDAAERAAFENVREIVRLSRDTSADGKVRFEPSLARGLSYYTGAIMEIAVPDLPGSLGGGGRYDNLIGMFLGRDVPACGFSLGLERIIVVMTERRMFPETVSGAPVDVVVTVWNEPSRPDVVALARELRAAGLRVEIYPDADKLGKQVKYASARGIPFVAIVGDDERARGEVSLKDLRTGEQRAVPRESAGRAIAAAVGRSS